MGILAREVAAHHTALASWPGTVAHAIALLCISANAGCTALQAVAELKSRRQATAQRERSVLRFDLNIVRD